MSDGETARGSGVFWAFLPAMLLGSMLVGLGTLAYIAIDDPSFALEPSYYDKAVHWDRSQAEARESRELGLQLTVLRPLTIDTQGEIELELGIRDRRNLELQGADVRLEAFPNAYAARAEQLTLRETSPGVYRAKLTRAVHGLWELRFSVAFGASHFHQVLRVDVAKGDAA